jgi:hypothetical protein
MQCKSCNAPISAAVMAETVKQIRAICQSVGMDDDASHYVAQKRGPLCRKCMQRWHEYEDDLKATLDQKQPED